MRIAEWAKQQGYKVVYYISPQVWAWKESRVKKMKLCIDKMLCILPFEKEYYQTNKQKILKTHKKYEQLQLKNNPIFRMRKNVRRRLHLALNGKFKIRTTLNLIGCSWEKLKLYLESKFETGMTWDNYGYYGWHIDHIIPVSNYDLDNLEELKKCMHYTNLQPLWKIENLVKGSKYDKYENEFNL